jgi:hypothetical protein
VAAAIVLILDGLGHFSSDEHRSAPGGSTPPLTALLTSENSVFIASAASAG